MTLSLRLSVIFLALLVLGFLYLLSPILSPFFIAGVFAYLANPLVTLLGHWRIGRGMATALVFLLVALLMIGTVMTLLPTIRAQILIAINYLQQYGDLLQTQLLPMLSQQLHIPLDSQSLGSYASKNASKLAHWASNSLRIAFVSGSGILSILMNFLLIPVLTFYLLRDWPQLLQRMEELIPRSQIALIRRLAADSDQMLMAFLRGQVLVMLALGSTYAIGLSIVGLKTAILIGLLSGLLSFVPYLGFVSGILMATLAMYMQSSHFLPLLGVWIVYGIGQILESTVFTPLLVGDRLGLHPVLVIFAVLAGGQLFGFTGLLLALPVTAILIALLRHFYRWYLGSELYRAIPEKGE